MKAMYIEATNYTPEISLDNEIGVISMVGKSYPNETSVISMTGKSYPENTFEFYAPVMDWLKNYFDGNAKGKTVINFEIIYLNSSSSKLFFDIFQLFENVHVDNEIEIDWIYDKENESALEIGQDFQEDFKVLEINLVEKQ